MRKVESSVTDIGEWQGRVGQSWASEWQRTDKSFANFTPLLIDAMADQPFDNVLDIGCGAGEISLCLAQRNPQARICGVDVSPDLVATARERATGNDNISFELANAAEWRGAPATAPDLLVSRHGVMFFDDPPAAFGNLHALAAPAARLVFSCFRAPKFSPFFTEVGALLPPADIVPDPHAPGPFAFADQEWVRSILSAAGWRDISFEPVDVRMIAGDGPDPVADTLEYFQRIGPAARILVGSDDTLRNRIMRGLEALAVRNLADGVVSMPAGMWIVRALAG